MILAAKDPAGNVWNEMALVAIGARVISYTEAGIAVTPDGLDLTGYAAACVATLAPKLVAAASEACDAVTAQVNVTDTHVPAYVNMARWVSQAGGVPAVDPYKTTFANFAASLGSTPANVAAMFQTFDVATPNLLVALNAVKAAAASPSATPATLSSALAAFETAIANEVSALNAALTAASVRTAITGPAAITIAGINA